MNKKGFTLAEVLITLGIIGVIAAITLPTLMTDTTSAQIGPKLAKAVASFEQANQTMLDAYSVDSLIDAGLTNNIGTYASAVSKHFKITDIGSSKYLSKDGMIYTFQLDSTTNIDTSNPAHLQKIGSVTIDINGNAKPGEAGTDIFYFSLWGDGSLRPKGGTNWNGASSSASGGTEHWSQKCKAADQGIVSDYKYCAGHVFENNLKVLYR